MDVSLYEFNNTILTIMMMFSSTAIVILGAYVYVNGQRRPIYRWFIVLLGLIFAWNWSHMVRRYAPDAISFYLLQLIEHTSIAFIGPVSLGFARSFRGWKNRGKWIVRSAFLVASLTAVFVLTMPLHQISFTELRVMTIKYSQVYYAAGLFIRIVFVGAVYYFIRGLQNPSIYWKKQLSYVGGSALLLALAGVINSFDLVNIGIELPLVALPFSLILLGIAVMKYQFMDILPYTLSEAVNFIDDGYMVFGIDGSLEDFNKRFFDRVTSMDQCHDIDAVVFAFAQVMDNQVALNNLKVSLNVKKDNYISGELLLEVNEGQMHLQYIAKAINDSQGMKIATIITFHDLSDLQTLYQILEERKTQLMAAKEKLEQHIDTVQELTVETERNSLIAEVHDTLGHSMTEVLTLLEKCDMILGDESPDITVGVEVIDEALKQSRDSLAEIRTAVGKFRNMGVEL